MIILLIKLCIFAVELKIQGKMKRLKDIKRIKGMAIPFFSLLFFLLFLSFFPLLFPSCASIGTPTGGKFDTIPPVLLRSKPEPNSTHFTGNKIELFFDEYVNISEPSKKVIITPPQSKMPTIKTLGKKITVELKDSLIDNTTYTFDFTNGIADNNENNAIEGFTFAFSTGDVIDSLVVSGTVLNAENLEPMPNVMVGLHSNLDDSAFTALPFLRTSVTNDRGQFWIRNVAPGTYKLYSLNDMNRNYKFDKPTEDIAFNDSLITPGFVPAIRMDTIRKDSVTIDTIKEVHYNRFIPDDAILYLFNEGKTKQYLSKFERPLDRQLIFRFNSTDGFPPELRLLDNDLPEENSSTGWFIPEYSDDKKNLTCWITDSLIYKQDTLHIEANYLMSDSLDNLIQIRDTLMPVWRNKDALKKINKKGKDSVVKPDFLKIDWTAHNTMEVFDTLKITFSEPLANPDFNKIRIQQKVDTLWEDKKFPIVRDTLNPRVFYVEHEWPYEQAYRITIDSASFFSIYGKWNDSISTTFKFNPEKEYGNLYVKITGTEGPGFGELLDSSDKAVRTSVLTDGELTFEDLKPGKYYLRYIEDTNGNGKWDTGNYAERRQPEKVYYFNGVLTIAKYSSNDQDWNISQLPVEKQKPLEITKNKPAAKQQKKTQQTQKKQQNTGRSSGSFGRSLPGGIGNRMPAM